MSDNILLPKSSKSIELAEAYADQEGKLCGFDRQSKKWEKAKERYLYDDIFESKLPADSSEKKRLEAKFYTKTIGKLELNPKIANSVMEGFPKFFGAESIVGKRLSGEEKVNKMRALRGMATQLTHFYLENILGMKVKASYDGGNYFSSDFEFSKFSDDLKDDAKKKQDKEEVIKNRYIRIIIFATIMNSLAPIFQITQDDIDDYLNEIGWKTKGLKYFSSKQGRNEVIKNLNESLEKVYQNQSLLKKVKSLGS